MNRNEGENASRKSSYIKAGLAAVFLLGTSPQAAQAESTSIQINSADIGLQDGFEKAGEKNEIIVRRGVGSHETIFPLMRIQKSPAGEDISYTDSSPTGMKKEVFDWMQDSLSPHKKIIRIALDLGLNEVVIGYNYKAVPLTHFSLISNTVFYDIDIHDKELSSKGLQLSTLHEIGHKLFSLSNASFYGPNYRADSKTDEAFKDACKSMRKLAIQTVEKSLDPSGSLGKEFNNDDPANPQALKLINNKAAEGELEGLFPTNSTRTGVITKYPGCEFRTFMSLLYSNKMINGNLSDADEEKIKKLDQKTKKVISGQSVYSVITDENYSGKISGHPQDQLDETAASIFAITSLYPRELGERVSRLSPEERAAFLNIYKLVMDEYMKVDIRLRDYIEPKIFEMNQAMSGIKISKLEPDNPSR